MRGRFQYGFTLALIPAFSPGEKEDHSPVFWNVVWRSWQKARQAIRRWTQAIPSPWGEGKGEGGRHTQFISIETYRDNIPKGLRHSAQRWCAEPTLGGESQTQSTLKGLNPRAQNGDATPLGLETFWDD